MHHPEAEPVHVDARKWSLRGAWIAVALIPVGIVTGIWAYFSVADALGVCVLWCENALPPMPNQGQDILLGVAFLLPWFAPSLIALILGIRAARAGRRSGIVAAVLAGLFFAFSAAWLVLLPLAKN